MRAIIAAIAALGGGLLIAACVVSAVHADASDALLRDLAGEIRRGLDLTWTRVTLEPVLVSIPVGASPLNSERVDA